MHDAIMGGHAQDGFDSAPRSTLHALRVRAAVQWKHHRARLICGVIVLVLIVASTTSSVFHRSSSAGRSHGGSASVWSSLLDGDGGSSGGASGSRAQQEGREFGNMRGQQNLIASEDVHEGPIQRVSPGPGWHGNALDAMKFAAGSIGAPPAACPSPVAAADCDCPEPKAAPPPKVEVRYVSVPANCSSAPASAPAAAAALPSPPHWPWVHPSSSAAADASSASASTVSEIPPAHGGYDEPQELLLPPAEARALAADVASGKRIAASWTLTPRQACDVELLLSGGFTPLHGFMDQRTYASVVESMRLPVGYEGAKGPNAANASAGYLWPMPITLDLPEAIASTLKAGDRVALRDAYFHTVAVLTVSDVFQPNKAREAQMVFGTTDVTHPAVAHLMTSAHPYYVGGRLQGIALPSHLDFQQLRLTPRQVRAAIVARGWSRAVAFQTRNPMHRAHIELTKLAAVDAQAGLLLHPVVGVTKPGDIEGPTRVRCYQAMVASRRYYDPQGVLLSLLPLAMRMAGPKEALWHAIIRKNHGAGHFIVGRDHAGCKSGAGKDFYGAYDAQTLVKAHASELGITVHTYSEVVYVPAQEAFIPGDRLPPGAVTKDISGTKFRGMMARGEEVPAWFSDPDVIAILRGIMPPLHSRGFVLLFTGLSGGGKTTMAAALLDRFASLLPGRKVTVLDGDVSRTHLSKK